MLAPDKEAKEDGDDSLDDGDHHRELHLGRLLPHDPVPLLQIPDDHWCLALGKSTGQEGAAYFIATRGEDTKTVENRSLLTGRIDSNIVPRCR